MLRVHTAHADAWEAHGRLREPYGGGAAALRGIRVMAAGVPHPRFNSADVAAADCDLPAARAWYAARGVDWGVRVPPDVPWPHGRHVFTLRMMELAAADFSPAPPTPGLSLRAATAADLDLVAALDAEAFGGDPDEGRAWLAPLVGANASPPPGVVVALALLAGEPVGAAYSLRSDGLAGPCLYLAGVGVAPAARRRGVAAAMSSWLLEQGFAAGAELAHLHPDSDGAARIYGRLGFTELAGLEIYVDL
jgi:ribosomal protein S18 acetylase RimI-like enzyme